MQRNIPSLDLLNDGDDNLDITTDTKIIDVCHPINKPIPARILPNNQLSQIESSYANQDDNFDFTTDNENMALCFRNAGDNIKAVKEESNPFSTTQFDILIPDRYHFYKILTNNTVIYGNYLSARIIYNFITKDYIQLCDNEFLPASNTHFAIIHKQTNEIKIFHENNLQKPQVTFKIPIQTDAYDDEYMNVITVLMFPQDNHYFAIASNHTCCIYNSKTKEYSSLQECRSDNYNYNIAIRSDGCLAILSARDSDEFFLEIFSIDFQNNKYEVYETLSLPDLDRYNLDNSKLISSPTNLLLWIIGNAVFTKKGNELRKAAETNSRIKCRSFFPDGSICFKFCDSPEIIRSQFEYEENTRDVFLDSSEEYALPADIVQRATVSLSPDGNLFYAPSRNSTTLTLVSFKEMQINRNHLESKVDSRFIHDLPGITSEISKSKLPLCTDVIKIIASYSVDSESILLNYFKAPHLPQNRLPIQCEKLYQEWKADLLTHIKGVSFISFFSTKARNQKRIAKCERNLNTLEMLIVRLKGDPNKTKAIIADQWETNPKEMKAIQDAVPLMKTIYKTQIPVKKNKL